MRSLKRAVPFHRRDLRSILPEVLEPLWAQFSVSNRVLDVLVPEVQLNRPGIVASVGEIEAGGVTQHVRVNWKLDASGLTSTRDYLKHARPRHRPAALAAENIISVLL